MSTSIQCPHCGKAYQFNAQLVGKEVKCVACSQPFKAASTAAPAPAQAVQQRKPAAAANPQRGATAGKPAQAATPAAAANRQGAAKPGQAAVQRKPAAAAKPSNPFGGGLGTSNSLFDEEMGDGLGGMDQNLLGPLGPPPGKTGAKGPPAKAPAGRGAAPLKMPAKKSGGAGKLEFPLLVAGIALVSICSILILIPILGVKPVASFRPAAKVATYLSIFLTLAGAGCIGYALRKNILGALGGSIGPVVLMVVLAIFNPLLRGTTNKTPNSPTPPATTSVATTPTPTTTNVASNTPATNPATVTQGTPPAGQSSPTTANASATPAATQPATVGVAATVAWRKFDAPDNSYFCQLPGPPGKPDQASADAKLDLWAVEFADSRSFLVGSRAVPPNSFVNAKQALDGLEKTYREKFAVNQSKDVDLNGAPGREFVMDLQGGIRLQTRIYYTQHHSYMLSFACEKAKYKDNDPDVVKFFGEFRFQGEVGKINATAADVALANKGGNAGGNQGGGPGGMGGGGMGGMGGMGGGGGMPGGMGGMGGGGGMPGGMGGMGGGGGMPGGMGGMGGGGGMPGGMGGMGGGGGMPGGMGGMGGGGGMPGGMGGMGGGGGMPGGMGGMGGGGAGPGGGAKPPGGE